MLKYKVRHLFKELQTGIFSWIGIEKKRRELFFDFSELNLTSIL